MKHVRAHFLLGSGQRLVCAQYERQRSMQPGLQVLAPVTPRRDGGRAVVARCLARARGRVAFTCRHSTLGHHAGAPRPPLIRCTRPSPQVSCHEMPLQGGDRICWGMMYNVCALRFALCALLLLVLAEEPRTPLLVWCPPLLSTDADAGAPAVVDCSQSAHDSDADIEQAGTVGSALGRKGRKVVGGSSRHAVDVGREGVRRDTTTRGALIFS